MADKTFRPITDVEVVEQMTENDTVLIERDGEAKRIQASKIAGEKNEPFHTIVAEMTEGVTTPPTFTIDITYDELRSKIESGEFPEIRMIIKIDGSVVGCEKVGAFIIEDNASIYMMTATSELLYKSDGTLAFTT